MYEQEKANTGTKYKATNNISSILREKHKLHVTRKTDNSLDTWNYENQPTADMAK